MYRKESGLEGLIQRIGDSIGERQQGQVTDATQ